MTHLKIGAEITPNHRKYSHEDHAETGGKAVICWHDFGTILARKLRSHGDRAEERRKKWESPVGGCGGTPENEASRREKKVVEKCFSRREKGKRPPF